APGRRVPRGHGARRAGHVPRRARPPHAVRARAVRGLRRARAAARRAHGDRGSRGRDTGHRGRGPRRRAGRGHAGGPRPLRRRALDDVVTPSDAARLALAADAGGPAVALITVVGAPERGAGADALGRRAALLETGELRGTLGGGTLDARAVELGWRALAGEPPGAEQVDADGARFTLYAEARFPPEELLVVG